MHKNAATAHEIKIAKIVPSSSVENVNRTYMSTIIGMLNLAIYHINHMQLVFICKN